MVTRQAKPSQLGLGLGRRMPNSNFPQLATAVLNRPPGVASVNRIFRVAADSSYFIGDSAHEMDQLKCLWCRLS